MLEYHSCYPLYLGIGMGFQLQQTRYEKRPLGEMNSETGYVQMTGVRVGQQVQLYYHGPCRDTARFPIPPETRAALVFCHYNDQGFRRTSISFLRGARPRGDHQDRGGHLLREQGSSRRLPSARRFLRLGHYRLV